MSAQLRLRVGTFESLCWETEVNIGREPRRHEQTQLPSIFIKDVSSVCLRFRSDIPLTLVNLVKANNSIITLELKG